MINGRRVLAVIPARGGSKGLPKKNIRPLAGKPLLVWSIARAREARHVDEVVVSTDDEEIAEVAREHGAAVPFMRPAALATDEAPTFPVVQHALEELARAGAAPFSYVALMEPTSPLRAEGDIDRMLARLDARAADFDSIVSLGEVAEHPSILKRLVGDGITPFAPEIRQTSRRQDNEPAYFPYCVAYIAKTDALLAERTFYTARCMGYRIERYQNYEIDDLLDFLCVEAVMRQQWGIA